MGRGLDKKAKEKMLSKMIHIREKKPNIEPKSCKDSSTKQNKNERRKNSHQNE